MCQAINESGFHITCVISGLANGVDTLALRYAKENKILCDKFPADWKQHGKAAGHIRNDEMASNADALILVWDGKSPGSMNMLKTARKYNLYIYEHKIS